MHSCAESNLNEEGNNPVNEARRILYPPDPPTQKSIYIIPGKYKSTINM